MDFRKKNIQLIPNWFRSNRFQIFYKICAFKKSQVFSCEFCAILQNQVTKFGQLIEREKHFFSKHGERGISFFQEKAENIFLRSSIKISENFDIKYLQRSKADLSKEIKKFLGKDTLRVSEAVIWRCSVKKPSLKNLPTVYLHIFEMDIR